MQQSNWYNKLRRQQEKKKHIITEKDTRIERENIHIIQENNLTIREKRAKSPKVDLFVTRKKKKKDHHSRTKKTGLKHEIIAKSEKQI